MRALRVVAVTLVLGAAAGCGSRSRTGSGKVVPGSIAVSSATATLSVVAGDLQSAKSGTPLPVPLIVSLQDPTTAPIIGAPVSFVALSGGGTLSQTSVLTDSSGCAQTLL